MTGLSDLPEYENQAFNKYNGITNINFPLHTRDLYGLRLMLNLSYNKGGVQVINVANWVGLRVNLAKHNAINREVTS
ncbi:hypothetical protein [Maribacter litoralis]|uniref:hypothetical protein n=1 Tax=Maribacter litoralis TaxID=2059726 RepID=UPI003F5CEF6E